MLTPPTKGSPRVSGGVQARKGLSHTQAAVRKLRDTGLSVPAWVLKHVLTAALLQTRRGKRRLGEAKPRGRDGGGGVLLQELGLWVRICSSHSAREGPGVGVQSVRPQFFPVAALGTGLDRSLHGTGPARPAPLDLGFGWGMCFLYGGSAGAEPRNTPLSLVSFQCIPTT